MNLTIVPRFPMTPRKTLIPTVQPGTLAWSKIAYLLECLHGKEFGFSGIHSTIEQVIDGFTARSEARVYRPHLNATNPVALRSNPLKLVYVQSWFRKIETKFTFKT